MCDGDTTFSPGHCADETSEYVLSKSSNEIVEDLLQSLRKEPREELVCPNGDGIRLRSEESIHIDMKERKRRHSEEEEDSGNIVSVRNAEMLPSAENPEEVLSVEKVQLGRNESISTVPGNPVSSSMERVSNDHSDTDSKNDKLENKDSQSIEGRSSCNVTAESRPSRSRASETDRNKEKQAKSVKSVHPRDKSPRRSETSHSKKSRSSSDYSEKRSKRSSKSSLRRRSRSPKKHSTSSGKLRSRRERSRSRSPRKSSHRSSISSRRGERSKKRQRSSDKKEIKEDFRIDKERLLRIAQERLVLRKEQEQKWLGPCYQPIPEPIPVIASDDRSVDELTAVCRRFVSEDDGASVSATRR
ncbi:unnamed protein product [Notodromas monacha]|uniref:Uncharacterized protein n=1 Tax=Notodromas monacha TaxID=399045 RepID=A0A7R9GDG9_9CRUS|nr:unnamed protein product [Notodromas monacha]CAG0917177.1 unnamed protein product [Notodromas monacha]